MFQSDWTNYILISEACFFWGLGNNHHQSANPMKTSRELVLPFDKLLTDPKFDGFLKENPLLLQQYHEGLLSMKDALEGLQKESKLRTRRDESPKRKEKKAEPICYCNDPVANSEKKFCSHCKTLVCEHCYCEILSDCLDLDSCIKCMKLSADPVPTRYRRPRTCGKLYYKKYLEEEKAKYPREEDWRDY